MIEGAEAYIWSTARVLEQRRFEVLFARRRPRRGEGRAGALQDRGRRVRLRAGARRARADEPAPAHLDRAGGARGRSARPTRACRDHLVRRSPRPTAASRRPAEPGALAAGAVVGDRATRAPALDRADLFAPLSEHVAHPWLGRRPRRYCWNDGRRDREDAPVRGRGRDHVPRCRVRTATARRRRRERLGGLVREQGLVGTQPEGYSPGEIHHPHDFATAPDSLARPWFSRRGDRGSARPPRAAPAAEDGGWADHVGDLDARDRDRVERAGDDRGAEDAASVRARLTLRSAGVSPWASAS